MALPHLRKTFQLPDSSAPCPLAPLRACPAASPVRARFCPALRWKRGGRLDAPRPEGKHASEPDRSTPAQRPGP